MAGCKTPGLDGKNIAIANRPVPARSKTSLDDQGIIEALRACLPSPCAGAFFVDNRYTLG